MSDTIVILDENFDAIKLKEELFLLNTVQIFALNYFGHKTLEKMGLDHEMGDQRLTKEDKTFIDDKSIDITTNWYNHDSLKPFLMYQGINLGSLIESAFSLCFINLYKSNLSFSDN